MNFYKTIKQRFVLQKIFIQITIFSFLFILLSCSDNNSKENFYLFLLIGQSNMAGRGEVSNQDKEQHPRVLTLDKEDKWVPAAEPIHFDKDIAGVGPGLSFGKALAEKNPTIRIGLIPSAAGGSPIDVWKKGEYFSQTNSKPYDEAIRRTKIAMKNGTLKGIIWHQGESDCKEGLAEHYHEKLVRLIKNIRSDLGVPDVPFVMGELGEFYIKRFPLAKVINDAIHNIPKEVENTAYVSAKGLGCKTDSTHFNASSARELGRRYAEVISVFIEKE